MEKELNDVLHDRGSLVPEQTNKQKNTFHKKRKGKGKKGKVIQ